MRKITRSHVMCRTAVEKVNKVKRSHPPFGGILRLCHLATLLPTLISEERRPALICPAVTQGSLLAILPLGSGPGQPPHPKTTP
jgi:hypothetical protein